MSPNDRMISDHQAELRELRAALETQRANYLKLHYAVMGDGTITSECHDTIAIAESHRKDSERLGLLLTGQWVLHFRNTDIGRGWVCQRADASGCTPRAYPTPRQAIDSVL